MNIMCEYNLGYDDLLVFQLPGSIDIGSYITLWKTYSLLNIKVCLHARHAARALPLVKQVHKFAGMGDDVISRMFVGMPFSASMGDLEIGSSSMFALTSMRAIISLNLEKASSLNPSLLTPINCPWNVSISRSI